MILAPIGKKTKRTKRLPPEARKPWMVGTNDNPPPLDVPWQMWSNSSSPYEQGLVQFEFTPKGIAVKWCGPDEPKLVVEWHELACMAAWPPKLREELDSLRERAAAEGYMWGLTKALERFGDRYTDPIGSVFMVSSTASDGGI